MFETITIRTTERHRDGDTSVEVEHEISIDLPPRDTPLPPFAQITREAPAAFNPTPRPAASRRPRFERQADGMVHDRELALVWGPTLRDCGGDPVRYNYADALKSCAAQGEGWRLPTRRELLSLVDDTRHEPAIDTAVFPDTQSSWYWTSTPAAWSPSDAWLVCFGGGYAYTHRRDDDAFVRAVRSVPVAPAPGQ